MSSWKSPTPWLYTGAAILGALMSIAAFASPDGAWPLCAAAIGCLLAANVDRFSEISASASGVRLVREATAKVEELSKISVLTSKAALAVVQRAGRMGGFPEDEKEEILNDTITVLRNAGLKEPEILAIREKSWDRYVDFDYTLAILGGMTLPDTKDHQLADEWRALRKFDRKATPDELENLLSRMGGLHGLRKDLLEDYKFYLKNRVHKRPEIWQQRNKVKRIPQ